MSVISEIDCKDCSNYKNVINRLGFFHKISQNILEKKPIERLLDEIITFSKQLLNAEASSLLLYNPLDKHLYFHLISGEKKKELTHKKVKIGEGIAGWVAEQKKFLR